VSRVVALDSDVSPFGVDDSIILSSLLIQNM
jgi:hypothetical protein